MTTVIKIVSWADGRPTHADGQYLCDWLQEASGRLNIDTTTDPRKARHYDNAGAAMAAWREQSTERPLREWDGQPNRPLTALTVEILELRNCSDCGELYEPRSEHSRRCPSCQVADDFG